MYSTQNAEGLSVNVTDSADGQIVCETYLVLGCSKAFLNCQKPKGMLKA
jgi:hypothetical protein